jgi:hypothetical protein
MNAREERGLTIAALCKLNRQPDCWLVPSQSKGATIYRVDPKKQTCTCPDHAEAGHKCKHLYAVEFTVQRETCEDGTIIDTRSVTFTEKKVTYSENWKAYNTAQGVEKRRLQVLLHDLCRGLEDPPDVSRERLTYWPGPGRFESTDSLATGRWNRRGSPCLPEIALR